MEFRNAMLWAVRRLLQSLVLVSPFTHTTTFLSVIDSLLANAQTYCYEMKVVQAFSWALFIGFVLALYILFQLVDQARRFGRYSIWSDPIRGSKSEFKLL